MQTTVKHLIAAALAAGLFAGLSGAAYAAPKKKKTEAPKAATVKEDPKPAPAPPPPEPKPAPQESRSSEPRSEARPAAAAQREAAPAAGGQKGGWGPCLAAYYIGPRAGYMMNDGGKIRTMELVEIFIQPLRAYDAYLAYTGEGWAKIARDEKLGR